jgi:hypothetical protein
MSKKPPVNNPPALKPLPPKKLIKPAVSDSNNRDQAKPTASKKVTKIFEAVKKKEWSTKKGEEYDGPVEYDQPELEEDGYF